MSDRPTLQPPHLEAEESLIDTALEPKEGDSSEAQSAEPYRPWIAIWKRFLGNRSALMGLIVLVLVLLFAFVGPLFWPYAYDKPTDAFSERPSIQHPFGTDNLGYDLMAQTMHGAQRSMMIAFVVAVLACLIGAIWGAVAGYVGGTVDSLMMRFVDLVMIFPTIAVAALLARQSDSADSWVLVALVLALLSWTLLARIVRSLVLSTRNLEYIAAARTMGAGFNRIVFKHLIPNSVGSIIVAGTLLVSSAILAETALSYLGFGVQPPDTSLGLLIQSAQSAISTRPWLFYFPGGLTVIVVLAINFVGDGLRVAFNPRTR